MKIGSANAALACTMIASVALADPPDSMFKIVPRPAGASVVGLTAIYGRQGLLYSADSGATFGQMCKAFAAMPGTDSQGRPRTTAPYFSNNIVTHDGHFVIGDVNGLWVDDGHGCSWRILPELDGAFVSELRFDPRDPKIIYGATATFMADNGLFRIGADLQVERLGVQDQTMPVQAMRVAALPNGGLRFYAIGVFEQRLAVQNEDGTVMIFDPYAGFPVDDAGFPVLNVQSLPSYLIRHSDDLGKTWTSNELEGRVGFATDLEGIDPNHPDRIVISRRKDNDWYGSGPAILDQLLVSDDRGKTFRAWMEVGALTGVSFASDGAVYIADRGEGAKGDPKGLWRADSLGAEPELIADYETWCVEAREDRLEVCQRFEWGTADPETGAFTKLTSMRELSAFHTCEGEDSVAVCRDELCASHCLHWAAAPLCAEHYPECAMENMSASVDAGAPDASVSADAGTIAAKGDGCSCSVLGRDHASAWPAGLLGTALAALFAMRRRRSRSAGSKAT